MIRGIAARLTLYCVLLLVVAVTLFPLFWMVSLSLMQTSESNHYPPPLFPETPTLEHYQTMFARLDMARYVLNSTLLATTVTALSVLLNGLAGYAFAKLRFHGRDGIFNGLVAAMVVPGQVGMLPLFLMLKEFGLINTYAGVVIPGMASIFGIFLVRQYALSMPDSLLDAARVDGAGEFRIFWSVALPLCRPILVTLAVFTFLGSWNDFMWPLIVLTDSAMYTLPVALANLLGEYAQDTELMMAGSVLTILPAILVFLALQRFYVEGLTLGGLKE